MSDTMLYLRKEAALARLVIDRPAARNAMSTAMWRRLPALVDEAVRDPEVKVLIVQGATDSAFAAGADIAEIEACIGDDARAVALMEAVHQAEHALALCPKPVIAMIRGICIGGGIELALACDLRFASTASTFSVPPARLGVVYSLPSTKRLVALLGPARAKDLLFSGRRFEGAAAAAMGLVDELWPAERIETETQAYAETLCRRSQYSIRAAKRIVGAVLEGQDEEDEALQRLRIHSFSSDDVREGTRAFLEKRAPVFSWS